MSVVIKIALVWHFFCQKRLGWVQKTQILKGLELEFSKYNSIFEICDKFATYFRQKLKFEKKIFLSRCAPLFSSRSVFMST